MLFTAYYPNEFNGNKKDIQQDVLEKPKCSPPGVKFKRGAYIYNKVSYW